ncbi:DUF4126 domain-containing protein [Actinospica robiniae]|uniref:DUF4126 domain-containing protein n=1 Tax=Actinospica robiniae TaxID=304901 RepID=UPI00041A0AC4|nr:DUF4126 domain-containing protein [Actinospica robiniae]
MGLLPLVFTTGWASGVNAYGVVLAMGLLGRLGLVHGAPPQLQHTPVLAAAAVMFALEFIADKIPYVDSAWDALHTVIRPPLGALVAGLIGHDAAANGSALNTTLAAVVGGGTALASHVIKATLRLAVNTSPEPFSNILISLAEDLAAILLIVLALAHPWIAATIAAVLLAAGTVTAIAAFKLVRRGWRKFRERRRGGTRAGGPGAIGNATA